MIDPETPLPVRYTRDAEEWGYRAPTAQSDTVASESSDLEGPLRDLYALVVRETD
ncbi:MAG: hypothetical protein ABEL97_04630 [Salinibacter sp.]